MNHRYMTRFSSKKISGISNSGDLDDQDKYLKCGEELQSESDSTSISSLDTLDELSEDEDIFSLEENEKELSDIDSDEEELEESEDEKEEGTTEHTKNAIKNIIKKVLTKNILDADDKQEDSDKNTHLAVYITEDEESEEEDFLSTISPEEKLELLKIESKISKINHKKIPLRYQILKSHLPIEVKASAIKKLESIQKMDEMSTEYHKISHWIDGLLHIPFNHFIETNITLEKSNPEEITDYLLNIKENLDASVYGHIEAKSTLLEIVASWITNPTAIPTVIGLQGPPGTGKTTLIKEGVAKALHRPFSMIALGGATDSSYLEGHGYTYEGSTWGRLVGILMETKCMNPVIFMDELDKVSETKHGEEIIGVLTHLVDYSQNNCIQDKYFAGIPLDFSKVLFIFSFNDESKLNPILRDRIHIIRTESSNKDSKLVIAKQYLIPKILENVKFEKSDITFEDETICKIIENYTEGELGVRNLKRCLESIILKLNTLRLTSQSPPLGTSLNTQLIPYYLNNYKLPMTITNDVVEKLLKSTSLLPKQEKLPMMYI